jgi:6-carboxyhexanoate--CoA ligase
MRASREENGKSVHISGAEKIVAADEVEQVAAQLLRRAMTHPKGEAESINLKVEKLSEEQIQHLKALPVTTIETATPEEGWQTVLELLRKIGVENGAEIVSRMTETYGMRGAMLLHRDDFTRLEPDRERGVRATYMDYDRPIGSSIKSQGSNTHFNEALVLATKVVSHPSILAEICVSDDPDYVTGYVASKALGYVRITTLKEMGDSNGGRIFLYDGDKEQADDCIRYLQEQPVLVGRDDHEQA